MQILELAAIVAIFLGGMIALSGAIFDWGSRRGRVFGCFCTGSALMLFLLTGTLWELLEASPWESVGAWSGLLLLATLFVYGAVLEIASWFGTGAD